MITYQKINYVHCFMLFIYFKENPTMATDEKRGITYQIAKNKGLTPRRKKELRNPRVKNRMKFRKAKIRRKGQVCLIKLNVDIIMNYFVYSISMLIIYVLFCRFANLVKN